MRNIRCGHALRSPLRSAHAIERRYRAKDENIFPDLKNISKASAKRNVCSKRLQGSSLGGYVARSVGLKPFAFMCVTRVGARRLSRAKPGVFGDSDELRHV